MTSHQKAHQICDAAVIGGLIEIASVALTEKFPSPRVDLDDVDQLLEALHTLRPRCAELGFLDGLMQLARKNWIDATGIFRGLVSQAVCMPASRSMLMYCMSETGDPEWRVEAEKLRQDDDLAGIALVAQSLIAREDLTSAIDSAKRTGVFVVPESIDDMRTIAAGNKLGKSQEAAPATSASDNMMLMQYGLRI